MKSSDYSITEIANTNCVVYADCSVIYNGRASSILDRGNYLIIKKPDGSIQIHTSKLIKPINYQPKSVTTTVDGNTIICSSKSETLKISVFNIHNYLKLDNWDHSELQMRGTERQMVEAICKQINYICNDSIHTVVTEHKTPLGPIDIVATSDDYIHVIEVKRKTANISAFSQIMRYRSYMLETNKNVKCWLMAPSISASCLSNCTANEILYHKLVSAESD